MKRIQVKFFIMAIVCLAVVVDATASVSKQDTIVQICRSFAPPKPKDSVEKDENHIYEWVQEKPSFPGREEVRLKWLQENISYPSAAAEANIQGTVTVRFVVEKDGSISNVKIVRGVHLLLDDEAMRLTANMPKWEPGKANGKAARAYFTQPINFVLRK